MLFKALQSKLRHEMGPFTIITNLPGRAIPSHWDHGYGPLARFDESIPRPPWPAIGRSRCGRRG